MPILFEELLRRIRDRDLARWLAGKGHFPSEHGDPRAAFAALEHLTPKVERWAAELAAGGWPESIDHFDLHHGNAVVREDGSVLIYDWEEAVISSPFFSIDELLWRIGQGADEVRAAYLEALPWGSRQDRERALDLGIELSQITRAHLVETVQESFGFSGRNDQSGLLGRALGVWTRHD